MARPLDIIAGIATPRQTLERVGARARERRLALGLTQEQLAKRSGVSVATLRNFEHRGKATLETAVEVAHALGCDDDFARLFSQPAYRTIDDVIERAERASARR